MAEKIIAAKLQVDTGSSNTNIKEVNKNLKEVSTSLATTGSAAKGAGKEIEGAGGHFTNLKEKITGLPGPLGSAGEGVGKLSSAFKALLANPVVAILAAIVALLALLYKAFTNTFAGGQKMEQVFAGIKAAGQALIDNLEKIVSAIVKLFKFDFSGAIDDIKGVVKAAGEAYTAMAKLTQQAQALHKEQLANDLDQANRAKRLAILREQATDDSIPIAKRKAALKELQVDAEQNAKDDIDLAKRTTENKIAQLLIEKDGALKNRDEINELKIAQINVETDNANELRRIGKQITGAQKQEEAERKAIAAEETARQKDAIAKAKEHAAELKKISDEQIKNANALAKAKKAADLEDIANQIAYGEALAKEQAKLDAAEVKRLFDNEQLRLTNKKKLAELAALDSPEDPALKIELIQAQLDLENSVLSENDIQRQINAKKASDDIVQVKKDEVEAKRQLNEIEAENQRKTVSAIGDAFETLANIAGKQTAAGKALAIASTTIKTFQGAISAFTGVIEQIPGPVGLVLGAVAAAGVVASGVAAVKKIVAVKVPGQAGGGSAPSGIPIPAAPIAPVQQGVKIDQDSVNRSGSAVGNARVFVLDSDVSDHQERSARLNRAARLGG